MVFIIKYTSIDNLYKLMTNIENGLEIYNSDFNETKEHKPFVINETETEIQELYSNCGFITTTLSLNIYRLIGDRKATIINQSHNYSDITAINNIYHDYSNKSDKKQNINYAFYDHLKKTNIERSFVWNIITLDHINFLSDFEKKFTIVLDNTEYLYDDTGNLIKNFESINFTFSNQHNMFIDEILYIQQDILYINVNRQFKFKNPVKRLYQIKKTKNLEFKEYNPLGYTIKNNQYLICINCNNIIVGKFYIYQCKSQNSRSKDFFKTYQYEKKCISGIPYCRYCYQPDVKYHSFTPYNYFDVVQNGYFINERQKHKTLLFAKCIDKIIDMPSDQIDGLEIDIENDIVLISKLIRDKTKYTIRIENLY
jgi:hypothetical protein